MSKRNESLSMTYTSCTVVIKGPIALCDNGFVP